MTTDWIQQHPNRRLTREEAAAFLAVSTKTVDRWAQAGVLKPRKAPGTRRVVFLFRDVDAVGQAG